MSSKRLALINHSKVENQENNRTHSSYLSTGFLSCCFLFFSVISLGNQPNGDWKAPASADAVTNPFKGSPAAAETGKKIYTQYCVVCHGPKGKGDGPAAPALNPKPADHSSPKIQNQTDGALFWKLTTGRAPMASYATTFTVDQRWQLVCYIRTLKKV
ncbi:MAG: cytochrome c [Saprospiraceae bacterium]